MSARTPLPPSVMDPPANQGARAPAPLGAARGAILAVGFLLAAIVALFIQGNVFPWAVAVLGLALGALTAITEDAKTFLLAGAGLTVALISIQVQPYNPAWLTSIVLYEKVFITHALLVVSLAYFIRFARR